MILTVDKSSAEPIYLQIRTQIIAAIAQGDLQPGDVLPSVRNLARDLGVNLHTVNKAYAVLQDEGHVLMRGRGGTIVADLQASAPSDHREKTDDRMLAALEQLAAEYRACGGTADEFTALAERAARAGYPKGDE